MPLQLRTIARKVPEVTLLFWVIKLLTTAVGEGASDYLVNGFNPYVVVMSGFLAFLITLGVQFAVRRYIPWIYWLTVLMVAIFGTMAADVIHVALGVPYIVSTVVFAVCLAAIFWIWKRTEGTLSIHSITTRRREVFYWATVLATFALGTAAGDLAAYAAHLGFLVAGLVFAVLFLVPAIGHKAFGWNAIFSFWAAYILTRPFGASFADWTGKSTAVGGLGWGDGPVVLVLGIAIALCIGYLTLARTPEAATPPR